MSKKIYTSFKTILLFVLLISTSQVLANQSCKNLFAAKVVDHKKINFEINHGLDLVIQRVPGNLFSKEQLSEFLKSQPEFILKQDPPEGETLRFILESITDAEAKKVFRNNLDTVLDHIVKSENKIYTFLKENFVFNGHYYFIGNGMAPAKNILDILFEDSPIKNKIHSFRASRALFDKPNFNKEKLFSYFNLLGWGPNFPGKIILIDSVGQPKGDRHSLLKLTSYLVEYLETLGMSKLSAVKKVIPLALSENTSSAAGIDGKYVISHAGSDASKKYDAAVEDYLKNELDNSTSASQYRPLIFDRSLGFNFINSTYSEAGRWQSENSKYSAFGSNGIPTTKGDVIRKNIRSGNRDILDYKSYLSERYKYLYFRKLLITHWTQTRADSEFVRLEREIYENLHR